LSQFGKDFFSISFLLVVDFILYDQQQQKSNQDNQSLKKVSRYQALKATTPLN